MRLYNFCVTKLSRISTFVKSWIGVIFCGISQLESHHILGGQVPIGEHLKRILPWTIFLKSSFSQMIRRIIPYELNIRPTTDFKD